ncbi:unnamed protein product (macronuclear) [Paramecium tetraurelia]|uniref:G domain-containing protein n=1 Tax=Paramecium tetraurelia TaxID=5888 RepID=A0CC98_PARTE|nr:uncharacterized protein GSPATT00037199001 [Paramecium tetraurelia]CAK68415.1 unnamed protein product [Paramecium tetraurelia]|eukprot:XP_001435812.1 hypothetical protein (macronuclear) [Paramecium tetraurelia strain d4-2]
MKLDENQKNLKILEEISQCKDNILRFLKEEINQSLLHSLLDNLALNNCKLSSLEVNSALVMENMNKIKQLSDLLIVEEMQETILKNLVLEASYTNLIKKSKTLQVIKVMDLLKESFDHIKSVNSMDLVFFLGGTGSGKSTSINYYLGHELEEYNRYGRKFLKLKLEKDLPLNEFAKIGHSIAVSETTFVQGYKVARKEKLMLCDCPGFDDTRGDIYDLTTVLSIDQTIKNCNSIKAIVLTLSYESFFVNRSSAIIQLFENVRQLIPNIFNDNQVKNSVYLLITKANNSNQLKEVLTMLIQDAYKTDNQMLNYLEEQDNQYNLKNTKNMERLQIWQFVLYLIQNQRVISYNIINQMEALDQLVDFENMMGIDKNQFCKAMDRSDKKQLAFSKYIIFQLDTWQRQIFEKFFHEIPQEIKNAETWINQKQTSIKEKEKENKLEEERIQYLKTKIAEFENEIQTLQKLSNNKEQIIQKLNTKNKFSDQIRKDAEGEIENLNCYIKKKNGILERNKKEIESFKNEIQNIQNEIKKLEQDNTKLSEGNTYKIIYMNLDNFGMNEKLEYWVSKQFT